MRVEMENGKSFPLDIHLMNYSSEKWEKQLRSAI
jgi:hypothetical protein